MKTERAKALKLSSTQVAAIVAGKKTRHMVPLAKQPPANFMQGDLAPITNGEGLWAISNSGWSAGTRGAWPADPLPGLPCALGLKGELRYLVEAGVGQTRDTSPGEVRITRAHLMRLHRVEEADARAEGFESAGPCDHARQRCGDIGCMGDSRRASFAQAWADEHGWEGRPRAWMSNPWCWVIEFEPVQKAEG